MLPREWLVSETFCLFKGKGKWQDPDRLRPIAMKNSIYRLLMRRVHATLYPLISPHPSTHANSAVNGDAPQYRPPTPLCMTSNSMTDSKPS